MSTYRRAEPVVLDRVALWRECARSVRPPHQTWAAIGHRPWRTSWLRITPVTPLLWHQRRVTSGPNAIPTPCGKKNRRFSTVAPRFDVPGGPASLAESGHQRHPLTRLLGPRPGSSWGSVHRSYVRPHSSADGVLRPACGRERGEPTSPVDAVRPSSAYETAAGRCGAGARAYT